MKLPSCGGSIEVGDLVVVDSPLWDDDIDPCEIVVFANGRLATRRAHNVRRGSLGIIIKLDGKISDTGPLHTNALDAHLLVAGPMVVRLSAWSLCSPG